MWDCDNDLLINSIKNHEVIWNYKSKDYCNKVIKSAAWRTVCAEVVDDFDTKTTSEKNAIGVQVQLKWKNLRDAFMRYCRNAKKARDTSSATPKQYPYYEQMIFLKNLEDYKSMPNLWLRNEFNENTSETNYRKHKLVMDNEEEFIEKISRRIEDKIQNEPTQDDDKFFLLSLVGEFKKISDSHKLDAKTEIIKVIKTYRNRSAPSTSSGSIYIFQNTNSSPPSGISKVKTTKVKQETASRPSTSDIFFYSTENQPLPSRMSDPETSRVDSDAQSLSSDITVENTFDFVKSEVMED